MTHFRAVVAVFAALFAGAVTSTAAPANANNKGHAHHLLNAEEDLVEAEAAIAQANLKQAEKHVGAAIKQLEEAIAHHHKNHIATQGKTGAGGSINNSKHHHHHNLLKQALDELRIAERELKAGQGANASKEIAKAAKTIKAAVASHHHLFGKA